MTVPIKEVIPREIEENIIPIINWFADLLDETVNFGSHILTWDIHPKTSGEENVPPTMLFRHYLDILDSISILVRQGTGDTPKILLRAAFEVMLYIEYLFEKDTYDRSMAFIIADTLNQMRVAKKLDPKTEGGKDLYKTFKEENLLTNLNITDTSELDDFLASKERLLNMPQFTKAYKEFQRIKKQREGTPKWYRYFNGPKNIEGLAKYLNQKTMYEILYRKWSGAVHGSDIYLGKISSTEEEGRVDIVQIRFIKDLQEVASYSLTLSLKVFRLFILNRIPNKQNELTKWYLTMKDPLMKITSKQYIKVV